MAPGRGYGAAVRCGRLSSRLLSAGPPVLLGSPPGPSRDATGPPVWRTPRDLVLALRGGQPTLCGDRACPRASAWTRAQRVTAVRARRRRPTSEIDRRRWLPRGPAPPAD